MASKLPKKEADMFSQLITCYEKKEYRKGIRTADMILKKHPQHPETLSMKGLVLYHLNENKTGAYELAKKGVTLDSKSHICWHVYGLLFKSDNNYVEALNCYREALKIDTKNNNVMKDLSFLQIQVSSFHISVTSGDFL